MTPEMLIGLQGVLRLAWCLPFSALYFLGGREWRRRDGTIRHMKWLRRWAGGLLFPAGLIGLALWLGVFRWVMLGAFVTYPAALHLGYGGDTTWQKMRRRGLYGLALGLAGLPLILAQFAYWPLLAGQCLIAVIANGWFGTRNTIPAAHEEVLIAACSTMVVPFMV